jgi:hypothetical protein
MFGTMHCIHHSAGYYHHTMTHKNWQHTLLLSHELVHISSVGGWWLEQFPFYDFYKCEISSNAI